MAYPRREVRQWVLHGLGGAAHRTPVMEAIGGAHTLGRRVQGRSDPLPHGERRAHHQRRRPPRDARQSHALAPCHAADGKRRFTSETLAAYEAGYRFQPSERLFIDLAFFYNEYRDLYDARPSGPPAPDPGPPPVMEMVLEFVNQGEARTWGMEAAIDALPADWCRLHVAYSWFNASHSLTGLEIEGVSPAHQFGLRSSMDLPFDFELEVWPRFVDELSSLDVDDYFSLDIRLGWRPSENLDVSLAAQNLFREERPEYDGKFSANISTAVERGVYGKITWRF